VKGSTGSATPRDVTVVPAYQHRRARVSAETVIEIRERYKKGNVSARELAKYYNVSPTGIQNIVTRRTWRGLP